MYFSFVSEVVQPFLDVSLTCFIQLKLLAVLLFIAKLTRLLDSSLLFKFIISVVKQSNLPKSLSRLLTLLNTRITVIVQSSCLLFSSLNISCTYINTMIFTLNFLSPPSTTFIMTKLQSHHWSNYYFEPATTWSERSHCT